MSIERISFYVVHPGACEPWWHKKGVWGMRMFCRDDAGRYRRSECGYATRERALAAIPKIWADALRTSVSEPNLEVITRQELFARLGIPDRGDPTPLSAAERRAAQAAAAIAAMRYQLKPQPSPYVWI